MCRIKSRLLTTSFAAVVLLALAGPCSAIPRQPGITLPDFNGDGASDLLDLDILGSNFGLMGGATFEQGDSNGDGNVDLLDLDTLGLAFGQFNCDLNGDGAVDLLDLEVAGQLDIDGEGYLDCCGNLILGIEDPVVTPEPSSALLLVFGFAACNRRHR